MNKAGIEPLQAIEGQDPFRQKFDGDYQRFLKVAKQVNISVD